MNEAFAGQSLSVAKELGLDMEKTNVNGGAIALGILLISIEQCISYSILMSKESILRGGDKFNLSFSTMLVLT